jgi:hypothetical protein
VTQNGLPLDRARRARCHKSRRPLNAINLTETTRQRPSWRPCASSPRAQLKTITPLGRRARARSNEKGARYAGGPGILPGAPTSNTPSATPPLVLTGGRPGVRLRLTALTAPALGDKRARLDALTSRRRRRVTTSPRRRERVSFAYELVDPGRHLPQGAVTLRYSPLGSSSGTPPRGGRRAPTPSGPTNAARHRTLLNPTAP